MSATASASAKPRASGPQPDDHDGRVRWIGQALLRSIGRGPAGPWLAGWWDQRLMDLTVANPRVKVQLFRFIDALPGLTEAASVRRHLEEYLGAAGENVPAALRLPMGLAPPGTLGTRALAAAARAGASRMAHRFIAGETPAQALATVKRLRRQHLAFTADLLGEAIITDPEANAYQATCLDLLRSLAPALAAEPEDPRIDRDNHGPIPRANLSLKLTSLTPRFDALHARTTADRVLERLRPILRTARDLGAFVNVDMEQYAHKSLTYNLFRQVLGEPEFRGWTDAGIVAQAYLPEALSDLEVLRDWAKGRGAPVSVRLVKGAYWDYEVMNAEQLGWPVPVYLQKWETDANYERCARFLLENREWLRPALGSHNVRSLSAAIAFAESRAIPADAYELQVLHGMGEPVARALVARGHRVRVYTPYGAMLPGMAYLVRRLLENSSNESFLKASGSADVDESELLQDPEEAGTMLGLKSRKPTTPKAPAGELPPFRNEPLTDFSRPDNRERMARTLVDVQDDFPVEIRPRIADQEVEGGEGVPHQSPGDHQMRLAKVHLASPSNAMNAVEVARSAFPGWAATPARERAEVLLKVAEVFRNDRFRLAAIEVFECGKPWREADGDLAEAIDFCEFYAREMIRLAEPRHRDVPGETNRQEYLSRGVVVVIPPWNFPLAIPAGMTAAALVAGNSVILKPAEQSPLIAWRLVDAFREAGLPPGVLTFLPGVGEAIGPTLVEHPDVDMIAFTGSRAVGLGINQAAATPKTGQSQVKRVLAEMGGKNAIIIDDDADLDEAVVGVLQSAFGYAGQKCSACSRVVVMEGIHDAFLARLVEAAKALTVGPADDPDTVIGPLIDAEARDRVRQYIEVARGEGRIVLEVDPGPLQDRGNFVGPVIVADVAPTARIAQEEVFGPILAVLKARNLEDALSIANGTDYALTGGLYSRSPAHLERARREFRVGNLYLNRPITGALVDRQPFGGFKLSGIGTKAGGPDTLKDYLLARTITENTFRSGFAPQAAEGGD